MFLCVGAALQMCDKQTHFWVQKEAWDGWMVQEFKAHINSRFACHSKAARPLLSLGSVERMQRFVTLLRGWERGTNCPSPCVPLCLLVLYIPSMLTWMSKKTQVLMQLRCIAFNSCHTSPSAYFCRDPLQPSFWDRPEQNLSLAARIGCLYLQ